MGLKYQVFIANVKSEEFLQRWLDKGFVDVTDLYERANEFREEMYRRVGEIAEEHERGELTDEEAHEEWLKTAYAKPEEEEEDLREYIWRRDDKAIHGYNVWWKRVPDHPDWILGVYTAMRGWSFVGDTRFEAIFASWMEEIGCPDFFIVQYHHNVDTGSLNHLYLKDGEWEIDGWKSLEEEQFNFLGFAERMKSTEGNNNIPLPDIHQHFIDYQFDVIIWDHQVWHHQVWRKKIENPEMEMDMGVGEE